MSAKRYADVSSHVERLGDDRVWSRYRRFLEAQRGFRIASLARPPDREAGEAEQSWVERARLVAGFGPFGHHTHWTSPTHARPTDGETGARVRHEGAWLREHGLEPTLFVGGGWYTDEEVVCACAELSYADCTPRARRPAYLAPGEAWAELAAPARIELAAGAGLLAFPTTHSVGDVLRGGLRPGGLRPGFVHLYFHDTDLLDRRRRSAIAVALKLVAARCEMTDLEAIMSSVATASVPWRAVARGGSADPRE